MPKLKKRKKDWAEQQTDKLLNELEEKIVREYRQALKEAQEKYNAFVQRFIKEDEQKLKDVQTGKITQQQYVDWQLRKLSTDARGKAMVDMLAQDLALADQKALSIINGYMPEAYATNFNYATYDIESNTHINTSFTLYNRDTVERLLRDDPNLLPRRKVDIPADKRWNRQHINSAITQGVLQGDSIPKIASRLQQVTDMDRRAAVRNARTMMTGAQNAGRMDAFGRAADLGIHIQKQWIATLDTRTRDSHAALDGEIKELDEKFTNGLMEPGDPDGDPAEVYNCRCTVLPYYPEYEDENVERYVEGMNINGFYTYEEWAKQHGTIGGNQVVKIENEITEQAKQWGIEYHEPKPMHRSEEEIIRDVGGGDLTKGSCASLSFCYAGNKAGYDVLDFRGGTSQNFFSRDSNINKIAQFNGVKSVIIKAFNDFDAVKELLKNVIEGKEYILSTGQHATIIRKIGDKYQYLELQSSKNNGFKDFQSDTLKNRFGCKRSHTSYGYKLSPPNTLIDVDSLMASDDFKAILGYINTPEDEQKKGVWGYAK